MVNLKNKEYILFDLDGTIIEPKEGITKSIAYALEYFGIYVKDLNDLCIHIGPPLKQTFMESYGFSETDAEIAIKKYRERFSEKGIYENTLYPGMDTLLEGLKDKKIALATSKPIVFADRILEHYDIKKYFHFISGSELNGERSNKGEVIKYILDYNKITSNDDVVMIGDRKYDIIGAKENEIESIGVLFGYGSYEELKNAGADHLAKNVDEIIEILNI